MTWFKKCQRDIVIVGMCMAGLMIAGQSRAETSLDSVAIVVHGGTGSSIERSEDIVPAVERALTVLRRGGSALDAAIAAVVVLEDDPAFNAGTGAFIRLDGKTVQMDAAAMNERGDFGAVSVIQREQHEQNKG